MRNWCYPVLALTLAGLVTTANTTGNPKAHPAIGWGPRPAGGRTVNFTCCATFAQELILQWRNW